METIKTALQNITEGCFMTSFDLTLFEGHDGPPKCF